MRQKKKARKEKIKKWSQDNSRSWKEKIYKKDICTLKNRKDTLDAKDKTKKNNKAGLSLPLPRRLRLSDRMMNPRSIRPYFKPEVCRVC